MYYLVDIDKIEGSYSEDALIEFANEEKAKELAEDRRPPRNKLYPDMDLDEALDYIMDVMGYSVIEGEELYL